MKTQIGQWRIKGKSKGSIHFVRSVALCVVLLVCGGIAGFLLRDHVRAIQGIGRTVQKVGGNQPSGTAEEVKTLYTCGMHPEVVSEEPGNCPKCGMKLVPMDPDRARTILEARGEAPDNRVADASDMASASAASVPGSTSKERKVLYWRAPMDPTYIRDKPGKSPMGMDLVPVYADQVAGGPTIRIDPVTEQNMGVRYDTVRKGPLDKLLRTVGTVQYDEQSLAVVTTKVSGWVEKVHVDVTGTQVHAGSPLFELYSPELYSAQDNYLVSLRDSRLSGPARATEAGKMAQSLLESARRRLSYFDISDDQIRELEKTGKVSKTLTIAAGQTGIVTQKDVVEGDYLKAGQTAYKIADLSTVWVIGKVYESDLPYIRAGQQADMKLDYVPGRTWSGRLTYVYPYLEPGTREVQVRMEFHNPGYELKPGMYATIELRRRLAEEALLVPAMAVINTGERQIVFVRAKPGEFQPRTVTTGVRAQNGEIQVLTGLAEGEQVVVSGQFLLDSESNLREATLKLLHPGKINTAAVLNRASTSTMDMGAAGTTDSMQKMSMPQQGGEAAMSRKSLAYVCPMPAHAGVLYDQPGTCPLCGMKLVPVQPWQLNESPVAFYTCPMPEHYDVRMDGPGKCPRCGMTLIPVTQAEAKRFENVKPSALPPTLYTCPMPQDADVVMDHPGTCPKCGMKLVPTDQVPHGREAVAHWLADHPRTAAGELDSHAMKQQPTSGTQGLR